MAQLTDGEGCTGFYKSERPAYCVYVAFFTIRIMTSERVGGNPDGAAIAQRPQLRFSAFLYSSALSNLYVFSLLFFFLSHLGRHRVAILEGVSAGDDQQVAG